MTYRYMPQRLRLMAQLTTLLGTALIGLSLVVAPTPEQDPKLTEFEQAMGADWWGGMLIAFGLIGFLTEVYIVIAKSQKLFWLVSVCHLMLMSLMLVYGAAALYGLIERGQWWNFAGPVLTVMIALWHYAYLFRKSRVPVDLKPLP